MSPREMNRQVDHRCLKTKKQKPKPQANKSRVRKRIAPKPLAHGGHEGQAQPQPGAGAGDGPVPAELRAGSGLPAGLLSPRCSRVPSDRGKLGMGVMSKILDSPRQDENV